MAKEKFGAVDCGLWRHREFKKLDDGSKLLFLYLKTCDHQNMIGCFHLPLGYMTVDLKWPESKLKQTLSKLFNKGFVSYCFDTEFVLLPKHLRKHPLQNTNQGKGAESLFNQVPSDFIYINDLCEILTSQKTIQEGFANRLKTLCNSVSVSVSVSVTETVTVSEGSHELEPEQVWHDSQRNIISDAYNKSIENTDKPKFTKWTDKRIGKLKTRCLDDPLRDLSWWLGLMESIPFNLAAYEGDWFTLDFLLKNDENIVKYCEGNYSRSFSKSINKKTLKEQAENFVNGS